MKINKKNWDKTIWITLINDHGISITISSMGASLVSIKTPDKNGIFENILLGFPSPQNYRRYHFYLGSTVGRVAGRIKSGKWKNYQFDKNNGCNTIHGGGSPSISYVEWSLEECHVEKGKATVNFSYFSKDKENGFPGDLLMRVTYSLSNDNCLSIKYSGKSNKETLFNPTCHAFFNLSGNLKRNIRNELLQIKSSEIAQLDEKKIPTGILEPVSNTLFDFKKLSSIDEKLKKLPNGFDTPFKVNSKENKPQIELSDPCSGRKLKIHTEANSFIIFSMTNYKHYFKVNGGRTVESELGLAIEPQMLPDAINHRNFGNITLIPNKWKIIENRYYFTV